MKMHLMRGLPASGKSTLAKKLVADNGNCVRINRDDLRQMCFAGKWSPAREKFIIAVEKAIAACANEFGLNPIIDDTNLVRDPWTNFAKDIGMQVQVHDLRDVSVQECLDRDVARDVGRVGPGVIYRMAAQAGLLPFTGRPIVICDIDGTIADLSHRLHYIQSEPRDYEAFFRAQLYDSPIIPIIRHVRTLSEDHDIVMMSGRPDSHANKTVHWLQEHLCVNYVGLLMRRAGDHRPDDMVKEELLNTLPKERIVLVIDDRPSVILMWKRNGLNVMEVGDGVDF